MSGLRRIEVVGGGSAATPEEAAAAIAAVEAFLVDSAPPPVAAATAPTLPGWQRAALHAGVAREPVRSGSWHTA